MEEHATTNMGLTLTEPEVSDQGVVETSVMSTFPKTFDDVCVIPCLMLMALIVCVLALCIHQKKRRAAFDKWGKYHE